ncbi:MAG: capsular biosynthesis protein [Acidimicrobiales bacterium]|nr:capsular biosynthesis protein [Acidimicrobiales bacterium]
MPVPRPDRMGEYSRKGVELLLRLVEQAPEHRRARRLVAGADLPAASGPRVLFLCPRDWAEHVQYQAMIGQALRLRGADVHFLTCGGGLEICDRANTYEAPPMPCRMCRCYVESSLRAHGFAPRPLRSFDGTWSDEPWAELDRVSVADLRAVRAEGVDLGAAVDIPVQWFLCAADLAGDPLAGVTMRRFLRSGRSIARALARALDELRPDTVVLLSGLFLFEAIAWAMCEQRSIDVVTYERAFLKETLVFSRDRPAGFYDFSAEWAHQRRPLEPGEDAELDTYLAARHQGQAFDQFWTFREHEVERSTGRLVTLFTNLTWDTAVIGRDCAFPDIRSWLVAVVEAFGERPEHRLVIRVHPSELHLPGKITRDSLEAYLDERFPTLPSNVTIIRSADTTSSYPLMDASDVGLVYTSTTGLELALSGTPVIVAGDTHYRGKGFTIDVETPEGFLAALDAALADPSPLRPDVVRAREYAHYFFFRAPVAAPLVSEPLPGLARITTTSLEDVRPGRNAAIDRICDGILDGAPFARS